MKCKLVYLVSVCTGSYEDYTEHEIFVTNDKTLATKWKDRYNRIIDENKDRIKHYRDDCNCNKKLPFWHDEIYYNEPVAKILEVEFRNA